MQKERDELDKELQAKKITIQKLVDENQTLSARFTEAQKEAEELIRFTKEFFEPTNQKNYSYRDVR